MEKNPFEVAWLTVGEFIRKQRKIWGNPKVDISNSYIQVTFHYPHTLREIPEAGNEKWVYVDDGELAICYVFNF